MQFKSFMKKYAVIGNPIQHSLSPEIHQLFATQAGIEIAYEKVLIDLENFAVEINQIKANYDGVNVTLPFKELAMKIADTKSDEVKLSRSANTLTFTDTMIHADSTDGYGLVSDLKQNQVSLENKSILLLGAGGAANGIMYQLIRENPKKIILSNRTIEKSHLMKDYWLKSLDLKDLIEIFHENMIQEIDLVINATSAGINSHESPINLHDFNKNTFCYDMMYGKETAFIQSAKDNNLNYLDGIGMLINQAAKSFKIWHGLDVDIAKVLKHFKQIKN